MSQNIPKIGTKQQHFGRIFPDVRMVLKSVILIIADRFDGRGFLCFRDKYIAYYLEHFEIENSPKTFILFSVISTVVVCREIQ